MEYRVQDGARLLTFEGELLSFVSSERDTSPRWTELSLYRTVSGKFVITQVGQTRVVHLSGCERVQRSNLERFVDSHPGENPDDWHYDECVGDTYNIDDLVIEDTRRWVGISEKAPDAISSLYQTRDGVRSLSWLASKLFEQAAMKDADIANAYFMEERI